MSKFECGLVCYILIILVGDVLSIVLLKVICIIILYWFIKKEVFFYMFIKIRKILMVVY